MLHALLCAAQVEYSSFCAAIPELHRLATTPEVPSEVAADARRRIEEGRRRLSAAVPRRLETIVCRGARSVGSYLQSIGRSGTRICALA